MKRLNLGSLFLLAISASVPKVSHCTTVHPGPYMYPVFFAYNEFIIATPEQREALQRDRLFLERYPQVELNLEGYVADDEPLELSYSLSLERAEAVRAFLVTAGIDPTRLHTVPCGSPFTTSGTEASRAMSRRVHPVAVKFRPPKNGA